MLGVEYESLVLDAIPSLDLNWKNSVTSCEQQVVSFHFLLCFSVSV